MTSFLVTRASSKNVLGSNGLYQSVANNVPAFEFNTDKTYRGLLVEPGATNLALHSQDFTQPAWVKIGQGVGSTPIVTSSYTTAPDGTNTGMRLQCNLNGGTTISDRSWLQQSIVGTAVPANASLFVKLNSPGTATFAVNMNDTASVTVTSTDWVRVGTVRTAATANYNFRIGLIGGSGHSDSIDISIWQAQLETGRVATSYIVTTGSTATRSADVITLTSASSLIGQTQGTFFVEFDYTQNTAERRILSVTDGTVTNRLIVWTLNNILYFTANTGTSTILINPIPTGTNKVAVNYNISGGNTAIRASVNGGAIVSATQVATPVNLAEFDFGNREDNALSYNGRLRALAVFKTILSDATLQALATP